jgi:hypothetical protein
MAILKALVATMAGLLPVGWWPALEARVPVRRLAPVSGLATMFSGFALGIPDYFRFLEAAVAGGNEALLETGRLSYVPSLNSWMVLGPFAFALFTPLGLLASYLCLTGAVRASSAWLVDDPRGDPLLTALEATARRLVARVSIARARRVRERLERTEEPDRLVTGAWAGLPQVDFVVLASRRKPGWEAGVFVITADCWYRLGRPFDMPLPAAWRTAYPLTKIDTLEVLRKGVPYELPLVSSGDRPRRLEGSEARQADVARTERCTPTDRGV